MEYKELQIGDWVLTPWEVPIRVKNAHDNHIETEVKNGHTWSFGKNYHCSPIPLTPEILEKNGFENNVGVCFHDFDTCRGKYRIGWNSDTHVVYVGHAEMPTYYINVHEFQNLLRAIGLRNIADNFIV